MTPEKWKRIKQVFEDVADLDADNREVYFSLNLNGDMEIRAEVEKMLAADDDESLEASPLDSLDLTNKKIGKYRIVREIGKGGMGAVYEAVRDDGEFTQRVALKLIKRGMDSEQIIRRFRNERQILASLEHKNITRLLDGGISEDGTPYFVMELVEGVQIDEYCHNLSVNEKLGLFRQVCAAIEFAHTRLVIHRDLKPSNILVTPDGTAKLLDFGIAKVVSETSADEKGTATQMGMMTLNYASPEQIRGLQVTTASDVYSLGVILYELLTGVLPYDFTDKPIDKVLEIITNSETSRPSANPHSTIRDPQLKRDLDNIILKALKKEPERRYASVAEFSEDIKRYLEGKPVSALPDTFRYRAAKFINRNKASTAAAAVVFLSLIAGASIATWQATRAESQRRLAEQRFTEVRELANKVVFRYHDEIAKFPGSTALREELVNDAVKYLDALHTEDINDPQLKLELGRAYQKIGDVQGRPYTANLGKTDDALASYQKAVEILKSASEKAPGETELKRELVRANIRLIALRARLGSGGYEKEIPDIVQMQISVNAADNSDPLRNATELADAYIMEGDYNWKHIPEKIEIYRKGFDLLENLPSKSLEVQHQFTRVCQRIGTKYIWLGDELHKNGELEKAAASYQNALPFNQKMFESIKAEIALEGETQNLSRMLAGANQNIGENYLKLGENQKGLEMLQKNLDICLKLAEADPKNFEAQIDVANGYTSFVEAYKRIDDPAKALEYWRKSYLIQDRVYSTTRNYEVGQGLLKHLKTLNTLPKPQSVSELIDQRTKTLCAEERLQGFCGSDSR